MHTGTANRPVQGLLTPSWGPRHNRTVKEEDLRMSGVNKYGYEKDMNMGVGGGWAEGI